MTRRSFLKWFGIGVPAAAVAAVVVPALGTIVPETVSAELGEWNNYYSEGDPELMEAIKKWEREWKRNKELGRQSNESMRQRMILPMNAGMSRTFFQYNVQS